MDGLFARVRWQWRRIGCLCDRGGGCQEHWRCTPGESEKSSWHRRHVGPSVDDARGGHLGKRTPRDPLASTIGAVRSGLQYGAGVSAPQECARDDDDEPSRIPVVVFCSRILSANVQAFTTPRSTAAAGRRGVRRHSHTRTFHEPAAGKTAKPPPREIAFSSDVALAAPLPRQSYKCARVAMSTLEW